MLCVLIAIDAFFSNRVTHGESQCGFFVKSIKIGFVNGACVCLGRESHLLTENAGRKQGLVTLFKPCFGEL